MIASILFASSMPCRSVIPFLASKTEKTLCPSFLRSYISRKSTFSSARILTCKQAFSAYYMAWIWNTSKDIVFSILGEDSRISSIDIPSPNRSRIRSTAILVFLITGLPSNTSGEDESLDL